MRASQNSSRPSYVSTSPHGRCTGVQPGNSGPDRPRALAVWKFGTGFIGSGWVMDELYEMASNMQRKLPHRSCPGGTTARESNGLESVQAGTVHLLSPIPGHPRNSARKEIRPEPAEPTQRGRTNRSAMAMANEEQAAFVRYRECGLRSDVSTIHGRHQGDLRASVHAEYGLCSIASGGLPPHRCFVTVWQSMGLDSGKEGVVPSLDQRGRCNVEGRAT